MRLVLATAMTIWASVALAQGKGPSDPQIAGIVVTANQIDIDAGKLAQSKSKSKDVQAFAKQMVTDHAAVNKQAGALAKKLGVTPADSETSAALKKGAAENMASLKKLSGARFNKAYIDHEVDYHQQVLDAIDKVLIPSAQNAELKGLIEKVRPAIQAHLDHAKEIQASLGKK